MTIYNGQVDGKTIMSGGKMNFELSLTEYSAKYKVSVSTLRRRIKKGELSFVQDSGKYLLPDAPFDEILEDNFAPSTPNMTVRGFNSAPPQKSNQQSTAVPFLEPLGLDLSFNKPSHEDFEVPALSDETASHDFSDFDHEGVSFSPVDQVTQIQQRSEELVELKKAFTMVLNEKEEQILQLKQHIADLQTLNKAFENEVERLEASNPTELKTSFIKHDF